MGAWTWVLLAVLVALFIVNQQRKQKK